MNTDSMMYGDATVRILLDTSVLVAAMVELHPAHDRALLWLQRVHAGGAVGIVAAHTLAELLAWYPRLWYGNPDERMNFEIIGDGEYIHWPDLEEDLSVSGILSGRKPKESPESLKKWLAAREGKRSPAQSTE